MSRVETFKKYENTLLVITSLIGVVVIVACIEIASYAYLKWNGEKVFSFFLHKEKNTTECTQTNLAPLFGYGHSKCEKTGGKQIQGYVVYENIIEGQMPIRILALGGSTTDPVILSTDSRVGEDNWPKLLRDHCEKLNKACVVYNGGEGGFTSSQELIKLIRDVATIAPDMVVSLNGINEYYFYKENRAEYPYISKYQQKLFVGLSPFGKRTSTYIGDGTPLPNFIYAIKHYRRNLEYETIRSIGNYKYPDGFLEENGLVFGQQFNGKPWDIWYQNARLMDAVSSVYGANYHVFLQPTMGVGNYLYSEREKQMRVDRDKENKEYFPKISELYIHLRKRCAALGRCHDLSDAFKGATDLYMDPRHPDRNGNMIQAEAIFNAVLGNGDVKHRQISKTP